VDFSTDSEAVPPNEGFSKLFIPIKYTNNYRITNGNPVLSFLLCIFLLL